MIKKVLINVLPYGLIRSRQKKKVGKCFFSVDEQKKMHQTENCKFSTILSIQGNGYSGHSALINLFQEYRNILECTKTTSEGESSYEIDFMRLGGGILDFEKYLNSYNIFQNDAAYHRLLKQMASCVIFKEERDCKELAEKYLSELLDMKLANLSTVYYNGALSDKESPDTSIYYIKNMSVKNYRVLTQRFLSALFNMFYRNDKDILMLDHFFTDYEWAMQIYLDYVPMLKVIALYRDPRDVYYFAKLNDVEWIPHSTVNDFIKWCGKTYGKFNIESKDYFSLRFEDLIMDYDRTVAKLEKYIGLNPTDHIHKKKYLDPEVSKNNISIWKKAPELFEDMKLIKTRLGELCYK